MKRILLVALSAIALSAHADEANTTSAQIDMMASPQPVASDLHVIPTVGMTAMSIKSTDNLKQNNNGVSVGGLLEMGEGLITFQTGLEFNQYGGQSPSGPVAQSVRLNYLSIPAFAKWNILGTPQRTVYLKGGLMPSFLVSQKWNVAPGGADNAVGFDVPAVIALGGAIPVTTKASLIIEASYIRSLAFIDGNGPQGSAHNEGLVFNTGVSISL